MIQVISGQALKIRRVLKKHLKSISSDARGVSYSFKEIQADIRSLVVTEKDVNDAVNDPKLQRDYVFTIRSDFRGETGKVLLISPKAKLYSKLSEFEIPSLCFYVRDRKVTKSMFKMKGLPLIFTKEMYAISYLVMSKLEGLAEEITWDKIASTYPEIILDYVDAEHELPIFDVATFMIKHYMSMAHDSKTISD